MHSLDDLYEMARLLGGIPVISCTAGSPAHKAGVRYGDVLVQMNGFPTPDLSAYVEAQDTDAALIPLTVIRNGAPLELVMVHEVARRLPEGDLAEHALEKRLLGALVSGPKPSALPS